MKLSLSAPEQTDQLQSTSTANALDGVDDTQHFLLALAHFRRLTGVRAQFHELPAIYRESVLDLSQKFKSGLAVCEGEDQQGHHDQVQGMDCVAVGTISSLTSERILCSRHFAEEVEENNMGKDFAGMAAMVIVLLLSAASVTWWIPRLLEAASHFAQ